MRSWALLLLFLATALPAGGAPNGESDTDQLLALHRIVLEAHLTGDIDLLLRDESDDYVVVSRGEISTPTKAERRKQLGAYLAGTDFEIYRDEVPPRVRVSDDGTLGWVIVQVTARGLQKEANGPGKTITFTSGWIELYEKRDGRWLRTGNVSNFKP